MMCHFKGENKECPDCLGTGKGCSIRADIYLFTLIVVFGVAEFVIASALWVACQV